jgi:two-component system, response regulator YesN
MKNLRVLIVDDESRIAQLISKLIHWKENGLVPAGIYLDGQQAYEQISSGNADIVITDIRMPVMDGLELIRRSHELHQNSVHFIVISGYREFEYAHTALKYGVEDYLLKPVNENELNATLKRLSTAYSTEQERIKKAENDEQVKKELLSQRAAAFLVQKGTLSSLADFNREYSLCLEDTFYLALSLRLDRHTAVETDATQDRFIIQNIIRIMTEKFSAVVKNQLHTSTDAGTIYFILNYKTGSCAESVLPDIFNELKEYVYAFSQYELTLAFGGEEQFADVTRSICKAEEGIHERIVFGTGKIISPHDLEIKHDALLEEDILDTIRLKTANAVQSLSSPQLSRLIETVFSGIKEKKLYNADAYYETACMFVRFVYDQMSVSSREEQQLNDEIHSCYSVADLSLLLRTRLCAKLDELRVQKQSQAERPIRFAREYVETHYAEKITLENVAGILKLNSSYFSTLFKKETGSNFLEYITEVRIEKAKNLLISTNDTMAGIAEKVGYTDARYFSQCFEKVAGLKPSVYRRLYS